MIACDAAFKTSPWLDRAKRQGGDIKIKLVDKAAMDRGGSQAQGATNTYLGQNDPADYARMVSPYRWASGATTWLTTWTRTSTTRCKRSRSETCRVFFIVKLANDENDPDHVAGAFGLSMREHKLYVYKLKARLLATP
jgi:hypothetical protein